MIFLRDLRCTPISATGARVGTWLHIHDRLREWSRIEQKRRPSPSEAIIDSQSVKSAAMVSQQVGFDAGKQYHWTKTVFDGGYIRIGAALCSLRLPVLGSVQEAFRVLKRVKQMGNGVSRLHTIWVDASNDCEPFMQWVINVCR